MSRAGYLSWASVTFYILSGSFTHSGDTGRACNSRYQRITRLETISFSSIPGAEAQSNGWRMAGASVWVTARSQRWGRQGGSTSTEVCREDRSSRYNHCDLPWKHRAPKRGVRNTRRSVTDQIRDQLRDRRPGLGFSLSLELTVSHRADRPSWERPRTGVTG
ncbi:mCG1035709 [Mus musculus]|nr:mCG1035709 [Mus musculus]